MSKSNKAQYKRKVKHKELQKEKLKQKKQPIVLTEEDKKEIAEKYGEGGIVKNTLKIWKDSSPVGYMTYFPVIFTQFIYTVLWFLASVLIFIRPLNEIGILARDYLTLINTVVAAVGIPLYLSYRHLRYNIRNEKYYFFNTLKYTLPASAIYVALYYVYTLVGFVFSENRAELISAQNTLTLYVALAMIGCVMIASCIAQILLMARKSRMDGTLTKLGVKIDNKKK
jgi:hypothetical protein